MSESENDEIKKQNLDANDNPFGESEQSDPFAMLSNGEEMENENTLQRLSHLEGNDAFASSNGESTTARLSSLVSGDNIPQEENADESTMARLGHINLEKDVDESENTIDRLGSFEKTFDQEDEGGGEEEEEGSEELSDASFLEDEGRGSLTDGFDAESDFSTDSSFGSFGDASADLGFDSDLGDNSLGSFGDEALVDTTASGLTSEEPEKPAKKSKKAKKSKTKAPKPEKAPKVKKKKSNIGKKKEKQPWTSVDTALMLVYILCGLVWAGGNVWGIFSAVNRPFFLAVFNVFGLILMMVPPLLQGKKRRTGAITLFDSMLAVSLALVVLGCMILLMVQSRYGMNIKAAQVLQPPAVEQVFQA